MIDRRQLLASLGTFTAAALLPSKAKAKDESLPVSLLERAYHRVQLAVKLADKCPQVRNYGWEWVPFLSLPDGVETWKAARLAAAAAGSPARHEARLQQTANALMHLKDDVAARFEHYLNGKASMTERCAHCEAKATSLVIVGTLGDTDHYRYGNPLRCAAHITTNLDDIGTVTDLGDGTSLWSYDYATNYFLTSTEVAGIGPRILKRWPNKA